MNLSDAIIRRQNLEAELNQYLQDPTNNRSLITATRGRLLRALYDEYSLEPSSTRRDAIKAQIDIVTNEHKQQINNRLAETKRANNSMFSQIPQELGLKFQKLSTNIRNIRSSKTAGEAVRNSLMAAGNVASMGISIAKAPIIAALNLGSAVAPAVGRIIVQPLQIPAFMFSKLLNPDGYYNGQQITRMGELIGREVANILNATRNGIRRI